MRRMLFLLLVAAVVSSGCVAEKNAGLNKSLLEIVSSDPGVSLFLTQNPDIHPEITELSLQTIAQLSKKYPVIYGNLPSKTLYRLDFKDGNGLLVVVDLENKKVLKYFRTGGVSLG